MGQRVYWRFDRDIPSDGMTTGTPRGPVDLVAVDRALSGQPHRLNAAEHDYLDTQLDGTFEQADVVAEGLGIHRKSVLQRHERAKKRAAAL